jgi:DsbC/DsbD-like thiol-disulfide interchange protein
MVNVVISSKMTQWLIRYSCLSLATLVGAPPIAAIAQNDFASDWSASLGSALRLVSAGASEQDFRAGVDIRLDRHAITYWRNPGDAGAPPRFSFAGSDNLARAEIRFPAPQRLTEAGTTAFGYVDEVVFPIHVAALDPTAPIIVNITVDYAVCAAICVPAKGDARLLLRRDPGPFAALVDAAERRVPAPLPAGQSPSIMPEPSGSSWLVSVAAAMTPAPSDLFVEAPEGWYFESRRVDDRMFRITLAEKPASASFPVNDIRLTFVSATAAFEATVRLDASAPR